MLASESHDTTIRIWDTVNGSEISRMHGHRYSVWSVAYSPDGTRIVSGGNRVQRFLCSEGMKIVYTLLRSLRTEGK